MEDANQHLSFSPFIADMKIDAVPVWFQFRVPFAPICSPPKLGVSVSHDRLAFPIVSFDTNVDPQACGDSV